MHRPRSIPHVATGPLPLVLAPGCGAVPVAASHTALASTIAALDAEVFDAFKRCAGPARLARHAARFDESVASCHGTGGVTWTREAMPGARQPIR